MMIVIIIIFLSSDVDQYGFERPENFDHDSYESFMSSYLRVLARRAAKWERLLENKPYLYHSSKGICATFPLEFIAKRFG